MINIELLRSLSTIKKYPTGNVIITEGEEGQEMYFILSGKAGVYLNTFSDNVFKISELGPGEIFGEMSLLEDQPRSATVVALEPLNVLSIDKEHFEIFMSSQPQMALKLMKSLSSRLRNSNKKLMELSNNSSKAVLPVTEPASNTDTTPEQATDINLAAGILFPPEHKHYEYQPPFDASEYIFEKVVSCPVCGSKFVTLGQKMSKLRSKGMDYDLRRRFENFDPLWFNVWTCPDCYYTNYHNEFATLPVSKHKLVTEKIKAALNGQKLSIDKEKEINQLFLQYYLLLTCAQAVAASNLKMGKIWMNLMWLYRDCEDEQMLKSASENALNYYQEAYLNSTTDLKTEDEQQICMILSELYVINNKMEEAYKYLMRARSRNGANKTFSQMAELRLDELKNSKNIS